MNHPFIIALTRQGAYGLLALVLIAACAIAHLFNAISSSSLFTSVMPVYGFTACTAFGLGCVATGLTRRKNYLLMTFFVVGAVSTFWIQ